MTLKKGVKLQEHQARIANKLNDTDALLLYHALGSGKTLAAINAVGDNSSDFIVPASLRGNLRKEFNKFTTSNDANIQSYHKYLNSEPEDKNFLVLDEAHKIGVADTKISKKLMEEARKYQKRLLLTGSPIRNHPSELAPLLKLLNPDSDIPINKNKFSEKFISKKEISPGIMGRLLGVSSGVSESIKNKEELRKLFKNKVDYQELDASNFPTSSTKIYNAIMSDPQAALYNKTLDSVPYSVKYKMKEGIPLSASEKVHANSYFNAARQISNSLAPYGNSDPTPKMLLAVEHLKKSIKSDPNSKALVYSNYLAGGLDAYSDLLDKEGISYGKFTGKLKDSEKKDLVDRYNANKLQAILLSSAGSEGLDLKNTNLVQILEPHWNQAKTDQVIGRAVRYKSHEDSPEEKRHVVINRYHSKLPNKLFGLLENTDKSVDEYLYEMGNRKQDLNSQFLDVLREEGLSKKADYFYHRTNNILPILNSGAIKSLRHLVDDPSIKNTKLSVEPNRWDRDRKNISVKSAISKMQDSKETRKIFLTKGAPIEEGTYGKYFIEKKIRTPKKSSIINLIPHEYTNTRAISIKRKAKIYVPDNEYTKLKSKFPKLKIMPASTFEKDPHPSFSIGALWDKVIDRTGLFKTAKASTDLFNTLSDNKIKKILGRNAHLVGSRGLGIATPNSDTDILLKYKSDYAMKKAIERLKSSYNVTESPYNTDSRSRKIFTSPTVDFAFTTSDKAQDYLESYRSAQKNLTANEKSSFINKKKSVESSFFFPGIRAKRLKSRMYQDLKLKHF